MQEHKNQLVIIICIALIAKKVLLPKVFDEFKEGLGANPDVVSLVSNQDALKIPAKYMDYVRCFLPWKQAHHADPNSMRFIREHNEHPKTTHIYPTSAVTKKRSQRQARLTSQPPKKTIALDKSSSPTTVKTNLSITGECTTSMAQCHKGFCLSMVHSGFNKMLSANYYHRELSNCYCWFVQKYWLYNYDYGFVFSLTRNLAFQVKFFEFILISIWFFTLFDFY